MEWYETVKDVVSQSGGWVGIATAVTVLIKSRSDKKTTDMENFNKMFNEGQEERENIRKQHREYQERTDKKIDDLEKKIEYMDKRNTIKMRAINSAYRCKLPENTEDCPVLKTLSKECGDDSCKQS